MHAPSEDPADIERVFRGLYAFFLLQENAQYTAQLNSKRSKTMGAYVYCIYFDCTSVSYTANRNRQSVRQSTSISRF